MGSEVNFGNARHFQALRGGILLALEMEILKMLADIQDIVVDREIATRIISHVREHFESLYRMGAEQDQKLDKLSAQIDRLDLPRKKDVSKTVRDFHLHSCLRFYGGLCPACGLVKIVEHGRFTADAEVHHIGSNTVADEEHTIPICHSCHRKHHAGQMDLRPHSDSYHQKCKRQTAIAFPRWR